MNRAPLMAILQSEGTILSRINKIKSNARKRFAKPLIKKVRSVLQ